MFVFQPKIDFTVILQSLALAWLPRTDGTFLTKTPQQLVADGSVARVPIVTGMRHNKVDSTLLLTSLHRRL